MCVCNMDMKQPCICMHLYAFVYTSRDKLMNIMCIYNLYMYAYIYVHIYMYIHIHIRALYIYVKRWIDICIYTFNITSQCQQSQNRMDKTDLITGVLNPTSCRPASNEAFSPSVQDDPCSWAGWSNDPWRPWSSDMADIHIPLNISMAEAVWRVVLISHPKYQDK